MTLNNKYRQETFGQMKTERFYFIETLKVFAETLKVFAETLKVFAETLKVFAETRRARAISLIRRYKSYDLSDDVNAWTSFGLRRRHTFPSENNFLKMKKKVCVPLYYSRNAPPRWRPNVATLKRGRLA